MKSCCQKCESNNTIEKQRPKKKKENVVIEKFKNDPLYLMFKNDYLKIINK
tara:strand:- start:149 stop:301 length:153 start_codon:yes stop_codon:yes gene_type:complete